MKFVTCILLASLMLFSLSCSKKESATRVETLSIEDYLIKNNEITGWSYGDLTWIANNISDLTSHINGEADIYQRHGFAEAAFQKYQGTIDSGERHIDITIYNQGNASNAQATYEDPDIGLSGAIEWDNGAGIAAHYSRFGLSQMMSFYRGPYFILLRLDYDSEESLNILKQFALNVDGKIQ